MKKVLILDLDSVKKKESELFKDLMGYNIVYWLHSSLEHDFSLEAVTYFSGYISEKRLRILNIPKLKKSTFDQVLISITGKIFSQIPVGCHIDFMTDDKLMQKIFESLQLDASSPYIPFIEQPVQPKLGMKSSESETSVLAPFKTEKEYLLDEQNYKENKKQNISAIGMKYLHKLVEPSFKKPETRHTLMLSIVKVMLCDKAFANDIVAFFIKQHIVTFNSKKKTRYHLKSLQKLNGFSQPKPSEVDLSSDDENIVDVIANVAKVNNVNLSPPKNDHLDMTALKAKEILGLTIKYMSHLTSPSVVKPPMKSLLLASICNTLDRTVEDAKLVLDTMIDCHLCHLTSRNKVRYQLHNIKNLSLT